MGLYIWKKFLANSIALNRQIRIAAICNERNVFGVQILLYFFPRNLQKRSDINSTTRRQTAKPGWAAAANQTQEKCFRNIIPVMSQGNAIVLLLRGDFCKVTITALSSGFFQVRGFSLPVNLLYKQRNFTVCAEFPDKAFFRFGFFASQVVIHINSTR